MSTTILEYSAVEAALSVLREKFSTVPDVKTKEGYEKCKSYAKEVGSYRIDLEKKRKEIKGPALARCKDIDLEAKRIAAELNEIEGPLKSAYQKIDKERREVEAAKEKEIQERIMSLAVFVDMARDGASSEDIAEWIEQVSDVDCAEDFGKFTKEALLQKNKTLESLQSCMESAINREIEENKLKAERAELEKQKAEQAEKEAAQLLIDIENSHELGLMMNEKFDSEKVEKLRIEKEEFEKNQAKLKAQQEEREKEIATKAAAKAEAEKFAAEERVKQVEIKAANDAKEAAERARLLEVKRQKDAKDLEDAKRLRAANNQKLRASVHKEIKENLMTDCNIDEETAIRVVKSLIIQSRVTIHYLG